MACASSSFTFNFRHNHRPFPSTTLCNCKFSPTFNLFVSKLSSTEQELEKKTPNPRTSRENRFGFRSSRPRNDKTAKQPEIQLVTENGGNGGNDSGKFNGGKAKGSRNSPVRPKDRNLGSESNVKRSVEKKGDERKRGKGKWVKVSPVDSPELQLRVGLDMCSKRGDVMRAIEYFDSAQKDGIRLGQYHYTVLLYLCSSAAVGVVRPAKSGSDSRSLDGLDSNDEAAQKLDVSDSEDGRFNEKEKINSFCNGLVKRSYRLLDGLSNPAAEGGEVSSVAKYGVNNREEQTIRVDDELKEYARKRGFEIYEKMRSDNIAMNEAALTSVARMAMSMADGDMAFEMVNQMKSVGISPRLRSYGPALSAFVNSGEIDKAFAVEKHMLEHGVYPEEPELQALLRVSIGLGKGDRVYYLLHKLRASVRKVSNSTADMIVDWFNSKAASRVGKTKWSKNTMKDAIANGGGGWHGLGWLGRGKWSVLQTNVGADGLCQCCREKLAIIDLDPKETESFAESVASIAIEREKHSNFQKFQKWLDYYGPFEAVVDGANVGLYSQKRFMPSKINTIVNGVRQKLPSKKWPLIVLHNRRITGPKMDEALLDKWRNADAIYATPTGSNDDWYWLYAAIKCKCLLVTNDEMRDHTFQLLGNDFFPRWKERHQVHFSFSDAGLEFHLPPPYSVVVQESEKGHWHIPIATEHENEGERPWLCIMRAKSRFDTQDSQPRSQGSVIETETKSDALKLKKRKASESEERFGNLRDILSGSTVSDNRSVLTEIEFAEKLCGHTIDFQI